MTDHIRHIIALIVLTLSCGVISSAYAQDVCIEEGIAYYRGKDFTDARNVLDECQVDGFIVPLLRSRVFLAMRENRKADEVLRELLKAHPLFESENLDAEIEEWDIEDVFEGSDISDRISRLRSRMVLLHEKPLRVIGFSRNLTEYIIPFRNAGGSPLRLRFGLESGNRAFSIQDELTVSGEEEDEVRVSFTPRRGQQDNDWLLIDHNAENAGLDDPIRIRLQGNGGAPLPTPSIQLSRDSLTFKPTRITRLSQDTLKISLDQGSWQGRIEVAGRDTSAFKIVAGVTNTIVLTEGEPLVLVIAFLPASKGEKRARLDIINADDEVEAEIDLQGSGREPAVEIVPSNLNFGRIKVDSTSAQQYFTVHSTGDFPLHGRWRVEPVTKGALVQINKVPGGGISAYDSLALPAASGQDRFSVTYRPESRDLDSVFIIVEDLDVADTLRIVGEGKAPNLTLSPPTKLIDFGRVRRNRDSTRALVVSNPLPGNDTLEAKLTWEGAHISDFMIIGQDARDVDYRIAPGDSLVLRLAFVPSERRDRDARLTIMHNGLEDNPINMQLTGFGLRKPFWERRGVRIAGAAIVSSVLAAVGACVFEYGICDSPQPGSGSQFPGPPGRPPDD